MLIKRVHKDLSTYLAKKYCLLHTLDAGRYYYLSYSFELPFKFQESHVNDTILTPQSPEEGTFMCEGQEN